MAFTIREFNDEQLLGEKLHAMRRAANLTLREMADITKIRTCYIEAFEKNAWDKLPEPLYTRNYLKTYVKALGGDPTYFLDRYEQERGTCDFTDAARLPRKKVNRWKFLVASRFVKIAVLAVFVIGVASYLGFQLKTIITAPALVVFEPADGLQTDEVTIHVRGQTDDDANIKINGVNVLLNKDGTFDSEIVLERGVNVITIEGAKRYSRTATEYRRVILDQGLLSSLKP